ncbi:MAG: D-alanyl-D-alanine carboxypeptidase/D-alanyl-D-alanine endopeptidase [Candidatus Zhuqueibacterota bacterium]
MKFKSVICFFFFSIALLSITTCSNLTHIRKNSSQIDILRNDLDAFFNEPQFANAHWGVVIQSLKNSEYIYQRNAHKNFIPASNMKLFTTAATLAKLGPDYTYATKFYINGSIDSTGALHGDVIIRGSGDPSISGRYYDGHVTRPLEMWADSLRSHGITRIEGQIIGDDNYFDDEIMGEGWAWDYQSDWYAAQISALSFNDNCIDVLFLPGINPGDAAKYQLVPDTDFARITNRVATVRPGLEQDISFLRKPGTNDVVMTGAIALNSSVQKNWFSVENPTLFTITAFAKILTDRGIALTGECRDIDDIPDYEYLAISENLLFQVSSVPLHAIITTINKVSQNLYAELLLRTLAAYFKECGSAKCGIDVVKEFLAEAGISPDEFLMYDGSGLSRLNMVTPMQIVKLLKYMRKHPHGEYFYNSLPVAGVDGSLKNRLKQTAAEGNVRAKTGFVGHTRSLSGFVTTADGEELAFSMIANNFTVPTSLANLIQDQVCERLANFSRHQKSSN